MKRHLSMILCVCMLAMLLVGCGAAPKEAFIAGNAAEMDYASDKLYGSTAEAPAAGENAMLSEQKLIRTVSIDAETEDLDALQQGLLDTVSQLGGYVQSKNLYNGSATATTRSRYLDLVVRIPAQKLGEFTAQVEGQSNVTSSRENVEDVTLTYVATESRITALETEQERLLELLAQAENMGDLLTVEQRLTEVRYELESITSQLRVLENKVSYATVTLSIREVVVLTATGERTVWQRIGDGFMDNLRGVWNWLVECFIFVLTSLPWLVPLAGVLTLAAVLLRRRIRRRKAAKARPEENRPEA